MFTFLNSIILSALFAALIPLLIHLFNKQKTKKIKFSSLRFLKKLEKHRLKKVKIYQILLILIRTLLIILLILAFARPTFTGVWSVLQEPSANTTALIILDVSLRKVQEIVEQIKTQWHQIHLIVLADDLTQSKDMEALGVDQVLIKGFPPQKFIEAIEDFNASIEMT